jgi:hypothetical protein
VGSTAQAVKNVFARNVDINIHLVPRPNGYLAEVDQLAICLYMDGNRYGSIARILKVNPQSVANWVESCTASLPAAPLPEKVKKAELDEPCHLKFSYIIAFRSKYKTWRTAQISDNS